jgi:ABC-type multidrug transport system fused ATPase/permease subunit
VDEYTVTFDHVTFTYNGEGEAAAIQNVNFTARQGEVIALGTLGER